MQVAFAYDGETGLQIALESEFDVIVSDVIMPKMNGIELIRVLRKNNNRTPVLLLTALGATDDKVNGLEAGADDYLVKPFEFKELLARIKALERRSKEPPPVKTILSFADVEMNLDAKEFLRAGRKIDLTPKEYALMEYFIRNQGRPISKVEIADKVWDIQFDTGTNIIEVYVNYLRNKVDKPFARKLIHTQFGVGYILREESQPG